MSKKYLRNLKFGSLNGDGEDGGDTGDQVSFRVVSWNSLADQYIGYQQNDRPQVDWGVFDPSHRHRLLGKAFQRFVDLDIDFIICLQEVDFSIAREVLVDRNSYTRLLTPTGYGRGDPRTPPTSHGRSNTRPDASCIFYKSSAWSLVDQEKVVCFNDLAGKDPESAFSKSFLTGNFGIIALFEHRLVPSHKVMVCNSHLFWDPKYEYVKLCQMHYLCLKIEKRLKKLGSANIPVLIAGDFNSKPGGLVHSYLSKGSTGIDFPDEPSFSSKQAKLAARKKSGDWNHKAATWLQDGYLSCRSDYRSAYAKYNHRGDLKGEGVLYTNSTATFCDVLDYIFFTPSSLLQTKRLPSLADVTVLPTLRWPSDHIPVGAEFQFR